MTERSRRRRPAPATLAGGVVTVVGLLLAATVDMAFFVLAGVGTLGPGVLRELGVLRDQDEFRRLSSYRAGYHAYLAGAFTATLLIAFYGAGAVEIGEVAASAAIVLIVLWLVWLFAVLFEFWGVQRAVATTLLVYGAFWLAFNVLGNLADPLAMLMQCLIAAPFLLMAWAARRWPRAAGVVLLVFGLAAILQFDLHEAVTERRTTPALVFVTFALPLLAGGVALLRHRTDADADAR